MSIKLTRRIASELMERGESAVRIKPEFTPDAKKALTREDVRQLIKDGKVYAINAKSNISAYAKVLKDKRNKGRRRGPGRRKGTERARGTVEYKKRIRGQRRILKSLKGESSIDNEMFKKYYALVKGGTFASKAALISRMRSDGLQMDEEKAKKLRHA